MIGFAMSGTFFAWFVNNKEWCSTVFIAAVGGIFALVKWAQAKKQKQVTLQTGPSVRVTSNDQNLTTIGAGASVTRGVITGSNNVQTLVINQNLRPAATPIQDRKPSSPTANEIRQKETEALKEIPLYLRGDTHKELLNCYLNLRVAWPIRIHGVYKAEPIGGEEAVTLDARFGEEDWGAYLRFVVKSHEHPILKTLGDGHRAFVQGKIIAINEYLIEIDATSLEFE